VAYACSEAIVTWFMPRLVQSKIQTTNKQTFGERFSL